MSEEDYVDTGYSGEDFIKESDDLMGKPTNEIVDLCRKNIIYGILKHYDNYGNISEKQKKVLCNYLTFRGQK